MQFLLWAQSQAGLLHLVFKQGVPTSCCYYTRASMKCPALHRALGGQGQMTPWPFYSLENTHMCVLQIRMWFGTKTHIWAESLEKLVVLEAKTDGKMWHTHKIKEPSGLQSMGSQRVRHDWSDFTFIQPGSLSTILITNSTVYIKQFFNTSWVC